MILIKYLFRQTFSSTLLIGFVLFIITLATQLDVLLQTSIERNLPYQLTIPIVLNSLPQYLSIIVPISIFLALIFTLGKLHSDYEIITMHSCAMSLRRLVIGLGLSVFLATVAAIYINLELVPNSFYRVSTIMSQMQKRDLFDLIEDDTFMQIAEGSNLTLYVSEKAEDSNVFENVFLIHPNKQNNDNYDFIYAKNASINYESGLRYLILQHGYQIHGNPKSPSGQKLTYAELKIKLPEYKNITRVNKKEFMSNVDLLMSKNTSYQEHFFWRISLVLTIPTLFIIALIIGKVVPRQGRFSKLLPAFIILITYFIALASASQLAQSEILPPYITLLIHFLIIALTYFSQMFYRMYKHI